MASLSTISIQRPVLATVFSLIILLLGIFSFNYLGVREFPNVSPSVVSVSTSYSGASAGVIEVLITAPLEEAINGISGIRTISSESQEGQSKIKVEFEVGIDLEAAANDVRNKVSSAMRQLPPDVNAPIIYKADADADPIIFLTIVSATRNLIDLSRITNDYFKEPLQTLSGVSSVEIWGEKKYAMRLWMDPIKLASMKLTPLDVYQAIERENIELPSGRIEGENTELTVRTIGRLSTVEDFNRLIIKENGENIVRFRDIGFAELGPENDRSILRRNDKPGVAVAIIAQPGSNVMKITTAMYKKLATIEKDLPKDVKWIMSYDSTKYVRASTNEVRQTLITAFILVFVIIFIFLRDWRTVIIPVVTIPISLIGSLFFLYLVGFTLNVLTMLGIVLAIGLVVDDAIVVLENIYVKVEKGQQPKDAAQQGAKEIYFAVISTTVAIIAVFLPIIFLEGITGRLFREFGLVISGAIIISSFVSLSITPMMSARLLKKRMIKPWLYTRTEPFFNALNDAYSRSLQAFMNIRWMAFVIIAIASVLIYITINSISSELAPVEDRNEFRLYTKGVEGATFKYMDHHIKKIIDVVKMEVPEVQSILSVTSPGGGTSSANSGFVRVTLKDASQRSRTQKEIVKDVTEKMKQYTSLNTFVSQLPTIGRRGGGFAIRYVIQAANIEKLRKALPALMQKIQESDMFDYVTTDLRFDKPEVKIAVDRDKAGVMGISILDISRTLQLGLSEARFGNFVMDGKQYNIIGKLQKKNTNETLDIKMIYVRNNKGDIIPLDNVIKVTEESTSPTLHRYDRYSSAMLTIQPAHGVALSQGITEIEKITDEILDETYNTTLAGSSLEFTESMNSLYMAFFMALAIIYLVLAGQFESFIDPLIIMFTVPLALAGTLVSLWYFDQTINIFSQIGMIMLIGLVVKNAILIIEFANQKKNHATSPAQAVIEASCSRFRPILMTSLSTICGVFPIALALGAGSESRMSMGIAIIGGLFFSTILTLYVIPALYSYLSHTKKLPLTSS